MDVTMGGNFGGGGGFGLPHAAAPGTLDRPNATRATQAEAAKERESMTRKDHAHRGKLDVNPSEPPLTPTSIAAYMYARVVIASGLPPGPRAWREDCSGVARGLGSRQMRPRYHLLSRVDQRSGQDLFNVRVCVHWLAANVPGTGARHASPSEGGRTLTATEGGSRRSPVSCHRLIDSPYANLLAHPHRRLIFSRPSPSVVSRVHNCSRQRKTR